MRRQLMQARHNARRPDREQPDPQTPIRWTSQTPNQVTALLARIDSLIEVREDG
jgi:hypothetical protein